MKMLLFTTIGLILVVEGGASPIQPNSKICPAGYVKAQRLNWNVCYKVYADLKTHSEAINQCKQDNGRLATIPDAVANSYIYVLAQDLDSSALWLGAECENNSERTCKDTDGSNLSFNKFDSAEPNTISGGCVYMHITGLSSGRWATTVCGERFEFVCEVDAQSISH